jgi:D-alanyl-lipoteichoic acid acyltransferase DltB (MBOAT superfamily)
MAFNSLAFFSLLLPTLLLYWISRNQQFRLLLLCVASLVFYGFYHWAGVILLLVTIPANYLMGRVQMSHRSKLTLGLVIGVNLLPLCWFKYVGFLVENLNAMLVLMGATLSAPRPEVFLPLGISFFTFQVIAYQIDIYRGEIQAERSLLRFAVFKCFFPQLIAGPIVRAKDFLPQLYTRVQFNSEIFHQGMWLVLIGLFLKIGVADILSQFADKAFSAPSNLTTVGAWTGLYAYSIQLFADFWGYSTMAVGLAALFGFTLPINFDTPYLSTSLQEFWRRWHITLSHWFRDYVYIPLGGNKHRQYLNLIATMTLVGLWHGAGWTFLIWGLLHGLWLSIERKMSLAETGSSPIGRAVKMFLVFNGVCLLWVWFRAPTVHVALEYFSRLLLPPFTVETVSSVLFWWLLLFAVAHRPLTWSLAGRRLATFPLPLQWLLALACAYFILVYAGAKVNFIYFTF